MYVFVAGNGIYFADRVVGSYYKHSFSLQADAGNKQQSE